jgi:hypothetical protein
MEFADSPCRQGLSDLPEKSAAMDTSGLTNPYQHHRFPANVKQVSVGRFIVEINGDGAVVSRLCG